MALSFPSGTLSKDQEQRIEVLRASAENLNAHVVSEVSDNDGCPGGNRSPNSKQLRALDLFRTKLEEAVMWAEQAILR